MAGQVSHSCLLRIPAVKPTVSLVELVVLVVVSDVELVVFVVCGLIQRKGRWRTGKGAKGSDRQKAHKGSQPTVSEVDVEVVVVLEVVSDVELVVLVVFWVRNGKY